MIYPTVHHGAIEKGSDTPGYDHSKEAVFKAFGKTFKYAKTSLYIFDELNPFRVACVKTIAHPWFDRFILFLILLNSLVLALTDWSVINENPESETVGQPITEGSWRNLLLFKSEIVFTIFFTMEFVLKVVAQGFFRGRGSYLRDSWNILDFMVVVTALLTSIPEMPKMSAIRVFRVLRPLKSISALPGLQKLVVSMLRSVPQLVSVVILLQFIFTVFGIFGIQIFAGKQHSRCRLTPYPVKNSFEIGMNYTEHRCLNVENFDVVNDRWTINTSPWSTPRECWWPIDHEDERLCTSTSGNHKCAHNLLYMNESDFRWCGSNYDALGNPRFTGGIIQGEEWSTERLMANGTYVESLSWGYTTFDNIFVAFLSIFQSITMEGWSEIQYQVKDAHLPILGDVFFIILILWGSFFTLNLLLAVLEGNFTKGKEDDKEAEERHRQALWAVEGTNGGFSDDGDEDQGGVIVAQDDCTVYPAWRMVLRRLVDYHQFQNFITVLIVLNTLVLAMDHHPMDDEFALYLEGFNFAFSVCFMVEMTLKLAALGPREYARDNFNLFDGFIVTSGLLELIISPPAILTGDTEAKGGGAISALRSFRLFRVFKLARDWGSMRELLNTLGKTLLDIGNFGMLLVLFMYIYALVGLQFFANRFHFDQEGAVVGIGEIGYYDADIPRSNFDSLMNAFTTIFEILSGENWNRVMYDARRATSWVSVFYFVSLIIMGMMIVMNLFLAILLSNFTNKDDVDAEARGAVGETGNTPPQPAGSGMISGGAHAASPRVTPYSPHGPSSPGSPVPGSPASYEGNACGSETGGRDGITRITSVRDFRPEGSGGGKVVPTTNGVGFFGDSKIKLMSGREEKDRKGDRAGGGFLSRACGACCRVARACCRVGNELLVSWIEALESLRIPDDLDPGRALFFLGPHNPIRRGCAAVVVNPGFDRLTLLLISVSSIALAMDNPLRDDESTIALMLADVEVVMTALFFVEMTLKICAHGFIAMPGAYLRNSWNVLDFVVVVISLFQLFSNDSANLKSLRSLRALRALRPLRMINRAPGLKIVLNALFAAIPDVLNVAAVCFMFFLIFAILGVNYFKGILVSCQGEDFDALSSEVVSFLESPSAWGEMSDEQKAWFSPLSNVSAAFSVNDTGGYTTAAECAVINDWPDSAGCCTAWPPADNSAPTSFEVCTCLGLSWEDTIPQQFDNVPMALLTFFEISTTEAWTEVMYAAVDATDEDMQPIREAHLARVWFFMLFMLIGSYLVMNLFVGVIIDNFNKMKSKAEGDGVLVTEEQQAWIKTQHMTQRLRPLKRVTLPGDALGDACYRLAHQPWFDFSIMVCIVLNTLVMAMQFFGQRYVYTMFIEGANYAFALIFTIEACVKLLAFRRAYFLDPWNRFDMFIVVGTNLGLLMLWITGRGYGSIPTIIRTFRIGRVLRLVRGLESMAQLFNTLLLTLPSLGNVGALLFLQFFIYAVMGVQLFATVSLLGAVDEHANFQTFWGSMVLLLRFSTGENWNGFMYDMVAERPGCDDDPEYDPNMCGYTDREPCIPLNGCGSWSIFPYMISFTLTITYVFMNLFIGVILDGFDAASASDHDIITQDDFARFAHHWSTYDPCATCFISVQDLHGFLQTLFAPWGFGKDYQASDRELRQRVKRLRLHIFSGNRVHFKDVLLALSEEVHRAEAEKKGATIELPLYFQTKLATGWQKTSGINREDYMVNPVSKEEITLDHILAAEFIQKAFRRFLEFRRIDCEIGRPMGHKPPATGDGAAMTGEFASVEGTRGEGHWRPSSVGGDGGGGDAGGRGSEGGHGTRYGDAITPVPQERTSATRRRTTMSGDRLPMNIATLALDAVGGPSRSTSPYTSAAVCRPFSADSGTKTEKAREEVARGTVTATGWAGGSARAGVGAEGSESGESSRSTTARKSKRKDTRPRTAGRRPMQTDDSGTSSPLLPASPPPMRGGRERPSYKRGIAGGGAVSSPNLESLAAAERPKSPAGRRKGHGGEAEQKREHLTTLESTAISSGAADLSSVSPLGGSGSPVHAAAATAGERLEVARSAKRAEMEGGGDDEGSSSGAPARTRPRSRPPVHHDL